MPTLNPATTQRTDFKNPFGFDSIPGLAAQADFFLLYTNKNRLLKKAGRKNEPGWEGPTGFGAHNGKDGMKNKRPIKMMAIILQKGSDLVDFLLLGSLAKDQAFLRQAHKARMSQAGCPSILAKSIHPFSTLTPVSLTRTRSPTSRPFPPWARKPSTGGFKSLTQVPFWDAPVTRASKVSPTLLERNRALALFLICRSTLSAAFSCPVQWLARD